MVRNRHTARPARGLGALALIVLLLSGCAGGPRSALSRPYEPALTAWRAEGSARAVILGVHGFGDYGESTFGAAAAYWRERGITTYAYDQRGFGDAGTFGHWPGADTLIADLGHAARAVRARHPGLPLVIVGHSMGGGVTLAAAGSGMAPADGLVALAPATWGTSPLNLVFRTVSWAGALAAPEKRWTGEGVVRIVPTDNEALMRRLSRDERIYKSASSRELFGLVRVMDRARAATPGIDVPVLVGWGAHDALVPENPMRATMQRLTAPKQYRRFDNGWHMLLRDREAAEVWEAVADWALALPGPSQSRSTISSSP